MQFVDTALLNLFLGLSPKLVKFIGSHYESLLIVIKQN